MLLADHVRPSDLVMPALLMGVETDPDVAESHHQGREELRQAPCHRLPQADVPALLVDDVVADSSYPGVASSSGGNARVMQLSPSESPVAVRRASVGCSQAPSTAPATLVDLAPVGRPSGRLGQLHGPRNATE